MDFPKSVPSVGLVDGKFVDEDPLSGQPGSLIPSAWGNSITTELLNVIEAAGMEPSEVDLTQLLQAIQLIVQSGSENFDTDTGAANVYTVAYTPAIAALTGGSLLRFKAKTANSAASTFSPNGLPAKPLVGLALSALQGGEIVADGLCTVVYSAALDKWVLLESTGGAAQIPNATKSQHAVPLGQIATLGMIKTIKRVPFASSGTYIPSPGMVFCDVEVVAGGGGGGGAAGGSGTSAAAGGGGYGGYSRKLLTAAQIGVSQSVVVGAAGAGGSPGNNAGGTGGSSSIGTLLTCAGGVGGSGSAPLTTAGIPAAGGVGGIASGGDINIKGSNGFAGFILGGASGGLSGQGGSGVFGPGGYPSGPNGAGNAGNGNGSGGSGGAANTAGNAGGAPGSAGAVFIVEYCTL